MKKLNLYTENGVQLNATGYRKMSEIFLDHLGLEPESSFGLELNAKAEIIQERNCTTSNWTKTVNGVSFKIKPQRMLYEGVIKSQSPVAIIINGKLLPKSLDTLSEILIERDAILHQQLVETIKEKNRLYRYRLQPLNEAYIYLFRRHEMGHLAYEMDDLEKLVLEKEKEIQQLLQEQTSFIELEMIKPWRSPKDYPEDEVPAFIPEPDIEAEIAAFNIAEGYEISLFAADPMIANPINLNWDTKGRAWVATSSTYPHIVPGREPNDKIVILEDTDGDGIADKHTVFAENLLVPHSVMPVQGGAYVTATTELLFFEDTNGDDVADHRRVVFDGFGNADVHHMIHGLRWMPWGDLHFTQSIYINSFIETPFGIRVLNGSGIWSFRPETESLEVYSRGLINPWGETFDRWGQTFATDGAGSSGMNYVFPESAHATAVGAPMVLPGLNEHTPKNTAAEIIYSRHFPKDWQGSSITNDFRANRTVRYKLGSLGSGFQSQEVQTILHSDHRSYRPVDCKVGPDGALYIVDWYNPIIDHGEVDFHHPIRDKTHGRIWKLTKKGSPLLSPPPFDRQSPEQLLEHLKSPEMVTRRLANRALVEKKADPQMVINWIKRLDSKASTERLEGLWLLAALQAYDEAALLKAIESPVPEERAGAIRMLSHWKQQSEHLNILEKLINDPHPRVRLESIHALRELGGLKAVQILMQVLNHPVDKNLEFALDLTLRKLKEDWLPPLVAGEPLFYQEKNKQLYALLTVEDQRVIGPVTRLLNQSDTDSTLVNKAWKLIAKIGDRESKEQVLRKAAQENNLPLLRALANAPESNNAIPSNLKPLGTLLNHKNLAIRLQALKLTGRWKSDAHADLLLGKIETSEEMREKMEALRALAAMDHFDQVIRMVGTGKNFKTNTAAMVVWIEHDPENAANSAVELLQNLDDLELAELIFQSFKKLEVGPGILQKALEGQRIPEEIASVGLKMVQTSGLNLVELEQTIRKAGALQPLGMEMTDTEKEALIKAAQESGNIYRGRQIYRRKELLCGSCHRIGAGGLSGPDLSRVGSYMTPNSILESILNPSADIKQNYETVLITKKNGEVISGLLHRKTDTSTIIRMVNSELVEIPAMEISHTDVSPTSLMPAGLTRNLHKDELKDLLAYLINLGVEN